MTIYMYNKFKGSFISAKMARSVGGNKDESITNLR